MTTSTDPLACHGNPHPSLPTVRDLTDAVDTLRADRAALLGYLDRAILALTVAHHSTVEVERLRQGIPARFCGPIPPHPYPTATDHDSGPQTAGNGDRA